MGSTEAANTRNEGDCSRKNRLLVAFAIAVAGFTGMLLFCRLMYFLNCRDSYPESLMIVFYLGLLASIVTLLYGGAKTGWEFARIACPKNTFKSFLLKIPCGIVGFAIAFLAFAGIMLPQLGSATPKAQRIACSSNLKQIGFALKQYAADNDSNLPYGDVGDALEKGGYLSVAAKLYICPSDKRWLESNDASVISYIYLGAGRNLKQLPPDAIIMMDKPENHRNYGNALFPDWTVRGLIGNNWKRACEAAQVPTSK